MKTSEKVRYIFKKVNWGQSFFDAEAIDRKSVVQGKSVDLGGRRSIKKKKREKGEEERIGMIKGKENTTE